MEHDMIIRALVSIAIIAGAVIAALNSNAPVKMKPESALDRTAEIRPQSQTNHNATSQ
jgi:hypothetical protein